MQMTLEARLLSAQVTRIDGSLYAKCFFANEPDGQTEALSSVVSMNIVEENADAVFSYVNTQGIQFNEKVRLYIKAVRGAKNTVRNEIVSIEALHSAAPKQPAQPTQSAKA